MSSLSMAPSPVITPTMYYKKFSKFLAGVKNNPYLKFIKVIAAKNKNAEFFLVGGMVRDIALGRNSKDYDIVVRGIHPKKLYNLLKQLGTVDLVGKTFGVYKFLPASIKKGDAIDVALPRTEKAFGTGGYKDVTVQSDHQLPIEKDLERRDFTINAMALELTPPHLPLDKGRKLTPHQPPPYIRGGNGGVIDPFGGLIDLQKKLIRCVGDPKERFKEDYSRMLRAIRLSCQLDFEIETSTWNAILRNIKKLNTMVGGVRLIPYEVIAKELVRAINEYPVWALELLDKSGVLKLFMPELLKMKSCPQPKQFHSEGDVWEHTLLALDKLNSKAFAKEFLTPPPPPLFKGGNKGELPPELVWSLLFHDLGKPYTITYTDRIRFNGHEYVSAQIFRKISDRLKLSSAGLDVDKIEKLITKHMITLQAKQMKETTIEKYFFSENFPGQELLMLIFSDISATIPMTGKPNFSDYKILQQRINRLRKKSRAKKKLPNDILDGHEIMKILNISPGARIKEIKEFLREKQLRGEVKTKKQAKELIKKEFES